MGFYENIFPGSSEVEHWTHNPGAVGSIPSPATHQGDIMTQPKTKGGVPPIEIHTIPKAKKPSAPKPKQTFVPKMTVMRKAGRGR